MRVWARRLLALVAWAFVVAIVIQVLLAGLAVFDGPGWWVQHVWWLHRFEWLTVVIVVLARSLLGERVARPQLLGVAVALAGVALISAG